MGLGRVPFDDPGEGMHAEIARELLRSRHPGALTLNGVSYVDKPPLLYVLLGGAFALAGPSETTARAVPALCALAAIAATAWLGAKLLGARGGFVAGTALLTSAGFFAFARYVRPETLFVAALAWGFALVLTGLAEERRWRVAAGLALFGVAALAKDPLGVIGPPAAIGLALALAGRQRPLRRWLPWPGVVAALGLGAVGILVLTALSPFRLPHYGLPAYFAVALLAARGWESYGGRRFVAAHAGVFAALALACALFWASDGRRFLETVLDATDIATRKSVAAGRAASLPSFAEFQPLLGASALVFAAAAIALGACALVRGATPRRSRLATFVVLASMLALLPSVAAALSLVSAHRAVQGIGLELARRVRPDDLLVHEGPLENSGALEWYTGHRPVIVDGRRSVLAFGALRPEARYVFWYAARLERAWGGGSRVWVVSLRAPGASVVTRLPGARLVAPP